MWFNNNNSTEIIKLKAEIEYLKAKLNTLEGSLEILKSNSNSLRGLVNRKLSNVEPETEKEIEKEHITIKNPYSIFMGG
jgi:hypothetical protein